MDAPTALSGALPAVVRLPLDVYGEEAVLRAAHTFSGRCFVALEKEGERVMVCRLTPRVPLENLAHIAGEFQNEVLDQVLRARIAGSTEPVRRLILAQAFSRTNLLHPELDVAAPSTPTAGDAHEQER